MGLGTWSYHASGLQRSHHRMNNRKNARLTLEGRKLLVERIAGISPHAARKWLKRFQEGGVQGLRDRSSRPMRTRTNLDAALHERIGQLRRSGMPMHRIATIVGRSVSTVSRLLARVGLSSQSARPNGANRSLRARGAGRVAAYRHQEARAHRSAQHRVTGDRRDATRGAGWELLTWPSTTTPERDSCACTTTSVRARPWLTTRPWASPSSA